jgi:hypothetical protein
MSEQDETGTTGTGSRRARLRARFARRPRGRSVALVAAGVLAGAVLGGTVSAVADGDRGGWSREDGRGGPGGHDGRGGDGRSAGEEELSGEPATQVEEAVLAEYPDAEIERLETDADGDYEAHIVTADGEELTVELDEEFAITGTE